MMTTDVKKPVALKAAIWLYFLSVSSWWGLIFINRIHRASSMMEILTDVLVSVFVFYSVLGLTQLKNASRKSAISLLAICGFFSCICAIETQTGGMETTLFGGTTTVMVQSSICWLYCLVVISVVYMLSKKDIRLLFQPVTEVSNSPVMR